MTAATATTRARLAELARKAPARRLALLGAMVTLAGGFALWWGLSRGGAEADRVWRAYHVNFVFWIGLAQGGIVFAATQKLAKGHWSGVVIRFAEASVAFLFVGLALFLGLVVGRASIFTWIHEPRPDVGGWLTSRWFFLRDGAVLAGLAWLSWRFVKRDLAADIQELSEGRPADPDADAEGAINRDAALVVLGYAFGFSLLGYDLIMSLAHKWVSNLYGAFYFMGSFLAALSALGVMSVWLRRAMGLGAVYSSRQQHDLGKLVFGFTVFWAYLMWAQFLVIWYGNLPEETYFIFYRLYGPWRPVGIAVFCLVFLVPFIGLLGVKPKKYPPTFLAFAITSLLGIWLERYLEVVPSINGGRGPHIGGMEIAATLFFAGLYLLSYGWFAARYPMISPRLAADALEREHH